MARGRKAHSNEVREARGNPGKRKKPPAAAAPQPLPPVRDTAPNTLSKEGRAAWLSVAPHLAKMQFLRATDVAGLARYCENLANWWKIERRLRRQKLVYETESRHGKMTRINPLFTVQNALEKRLVALEDRIGLSPRARQEILRSLAAQAPQLPLVPGEETDRLDAPPSADPQSPLGLLNRGTSVLQ